MFTWFIEVSKGQKYFVILIYTLYHKVFKEIESICWNDAVQTQVLEISAEYEKIDPKHVLVASLGPKIALGPSAMMLWSATAEFFKKMIVMGHDECLWLFYIYVVVSLINVFIYWHSSPTVFGLWSLVLGPLALFGPTLPSQCLLQQQQQQRCLSRVGMGHVGGPCLDNDIF